ncbi:MAG: PAS domain S-box protein [Bacteroidetes bacterium]|nr:PAS domain S-box protein [Bacteroidota bacterium]MBU1114671.1 PAS domain S-box protein [Bacteroidota bacterium]MBU1798985.1 PAS domain S-box protein [Bacteroidota bacterium]
MYISASDLRSNLPTFFSYAAHILKNEIQGQTKLKAAFDQLSEENNLRKLAEEELRTINEELENRVEERTIELHEVNNVLEDELAVRQRAEQQLISQYTLLSALINSPGDIIIFSLDTDYCYTAFNEKHREAMKTVWNVDIKIGMNLLNCMLIPELRESAKNSMDRVLQGETFSEEQHQPEPDIYYEFSWNPIFQHEEIVGITAFIRDITERKQAEKQIVKLNRIYAVLSNINQTIVRIHDTKELQNEVCHIAVEYGMFRMVWIGLVNPITNKVEVGASNGFTGDYLEKINIDLNNELLSSGPAGQAIKSGKCKISNNIETDETMIPWQKDAIKYGYKSSASFPLIVFNKVVGALSIYADEINFFEKEDIDLLVEMALDISFALEFIETQNNRMIAEQALLEKSEELERYFTKSLDLLCIADTDGYFRRLNPEWESTLGFPLNELEGKRFLDLVHPDDLESTLLAIANLEKQNEVLRFTNRYLCKDGSYKWIEWNSFPSDKLIYAVARDITERILVEQERLTNLHFFESIDRINLALQGKDSLEQMMSEVLATVLSIFDSDRVWLLYPCDPDASMFQVPMEITKHEYPGAGILNVDLPMPSDMADNLGQALKSDEPITFAEGSDRPINKVSSEKFSVKSMIMTAVRPKVGKPWAFGMHQCSYVRTWTFEEKRLFKEIGRRLEDSLTSYIAHNTLKESEEKFRRLTENARDVIYRMSLPDGKYEYVSPAALSVFGYSPEECYNSPMIIKKSIHPDWHKYFEEQWANLLKGEMPPFYEYQIIHKSGEVRWLNQRNILVQDVSGNPIAIEAIVTDITERKRNDAINTTRLSLLQFAATHSLDELLEETLNQAELLTGSLIGFYHFVEDDQKTLTLQNWSTRTKAEFCKAEGKGLHYAIDAAGVWAECVYRRRPVVHNDYTSLPNRKGMPEGHAELIRELVVPVLRSEKIKAVLGVGNKTSDYNKKDIEVISILADLTWEIAERKRAEEAVLKREAQLNEAQHLAHIGSWELNLSNNVLIWSDEIYRIFEIDSKKFKTTYDAFLDTIHPDDREAVNFAYTNSLNNKTPYSIDHRLLFSDGRIKFVHEQCETFYDGDKPLLSIGTVQDITDRKLAEATLRSSEAELRALFSAMTDVVLVLNSEGRYLKIAETNPSLLYKPPKELLGKTLHEVFPKDQADYFLNYISQTLKESKLLSIEYNLPIGNKILWFDATISPMSDNTVLMVARDITERKLAAESLRQSEERFRRLAENAQDVIYRMSVPDGEYEYVSQAALSVFGYSPKECYNSPLLIKNAIHPDWHNYFEEQWKNLIKGEIFPTYEYQFIHKSGEVRWFNQRNILVRNNAGNPIAIEGIITDITERKQVEEALKKRKDELERFERLTIGRELKMVELKKRMAELELKLLRKE